MTTYRVIIQPPAETEIEQACRGQLDPKTAMGR